MLSRILTSTYRLSHRPIRYGFSSISWKKIREKIFERQQYYKDYEMQSNSIRLEDQKFKIYITPRSPQVERTDVSQYHIAEDQTNFNMTFLDNLNFMGKDFTWNNRKNIGLNFEDIFNMEKVRIQSPLTIEKEFYSVYNNETTKLNKTMKIQLSQEYQVKISLQIISENDGEKWKGAYEMNFNDYQYIIQSAKKTIYYSSGLKTMIELQKREIIRQMDKRVVKNQQKQLKPNVSYDINDSQLLRQMEDFQEKLAQKEQKVKKPVQKSLNQEFINQHKLNQ